MFSIIIPNYNRAELIEKAVDSVLNQTFSNFELIIVDDCSTDNSAEVISSINDNRIKFFKLERNSGAAAARNFGIKKSSGRYISFLDSDDSLEPNFLETSEKILSGSGPEVGFMWTGMRFHYPDKTEEMSWEPKEEKSPYLTFLNERRIGTGSGVTIKKEVFEKCGYFNENLKAAEDTDFFLRITQSYNYLFSKEILINIYKLGEDRMSKNYRNLGLAYNIFIKEHLPEIDKDIKLKREFYYKLMWLNYNARDKEKARQYFKKIPKRNLQFFFKSFFIFMIYESLNLNTAKKIHKIVAA